MKLNASGPAAFLALGKKVEAKSSPCEALPSNPHSDLRVTKTLRPKPHEMGNLRPIDRSVEEL
jgi:hypothetical protein